MKKGFTLVELLAVIVILAIIALITVPLIINIVESSRKGAARSSAYGYMEGVNIFYSKELLKGSNFTLNGTLNVDENGYLEDNKIEVEGTMAKGGHLTYNNGKVSEGCLTINEYKVSIENDEVTNIEKGSCDGTSTGPVEPDVEESSTDWFTFEDNDDGTATITGVSDVWKNLEDENKYDIAIPSKSTNGNSVTKIGNNAFASCTDDIYDYGTCNLKGVIIPNSVIEIGEMAFVFNKLTSIKIPNSVTTIGEAAFMNNNLTSVVIPESVITICNRAFAVNQLTSVKIPNSVTMIGYAAFNINLLPDDQAFIYKRNEDGTEDRTIIVSYGGSKKDIKIPNNIITIEGDAFSGNQLTSVVIPNSVTTIGEYAFGENNLTSIIIPENVITIESGAFRKDDYSNSNLTKIINKTGKEFDWGSITGGTTATFKTGTIENYSGNIEVTDTE